MNHLNSILLEGVLVRDPEVAAVSPRTGGKLVKFTLASDRFYMDRNGNKIQDTLFISVQTYGTCGERVLDKLKKGITARVIGQLKLCKWQDKEGKKCSTFEIVARHVEYKVKKSKENGNIKEETVVLEAEDDDVKAEEEMTEKELAYTL